ncbi:MAG: ISAzo13 family transposase, partial [Verrucomicrobiota bacterium]|nr:ISAzo13 family transposase [Verrucomicrobiota bacterium]
MHENAAVRQRFSLLESCLDERMRRLLTAAEAEVIGYGGVSLVSRA